MLERCAQAVQAAAQAAGRAKLTPAQLQAIEDRLSSTMRQMARTEDGWAGMTHDQRMALAAERAMQEIQAEARRAADLKVRQVVKQAEAAERVQSLKTVGKDGKTPEAMAVRRDFELTHMLQRQLAKDAHGQMMALIEAAGDTQGAGLGRRLLMSVFQTDNPAMTLDILREVYGKADGRTGNDTAKIAAKAWLDTIEGLRQRFNAAGGDVGQLDYGYVPQPHDQAKVRKAGAEAWAQKMMPLVDRARYLNEDGSRMSDEQVLDMLRQAWKTIATDGLNKSEPGEFKGTGKRANRGGDHRELHFKDGDAWATYMAEFGRGSLYDAMMRHISGITRDIALVERYGPDANATSRLLQDLALRADGQKVSAWTIDPQTYWNMISGKVGAPVDESISNAFQILRNVQTAAKLGGAVISSFADLGTLAVTAGYNRLPYWQLLKDIAAQRSKEARDFMDTHGMVAEAAMHGLNRWSGDNLGNGWSGHMSNAVMRLSLLNAWTDSLRQGFTLTMNAKLGQMSRKAWSALDEFDRVRLQRAGITESDWAVLQSVPLEQFNGRELLTPQGIKDHGRRQAATETGAPPSVAEFTARREQEIEALVNRHAQMQSEMPAVIAAIDADATLSAADKLSLKRSEQSRVNAVAARITQMLSSHQDAIDAYAKNFPKSMGEFMQRRANEVAERVFSFIADEAEHAVTNPDLAARAVITAGGTQAGTWSGEIARTVTQFKAFPISMFTRHWSRMLDDVQGTRTVANRVLYGSALMVTLLGLGALSFQTKQVLQGKDPINMDPTTKTGLRFWARSLATGGGLGIAGDMILIDPQGSSGDAAATVVKNLAGPAIGSVTELAFKDIIENIWQAAEGKDTHWQAELVQWARSNTPGASLWWVKPFLEHSFLNALNESLSPGYLARIQARAQQDWGQRYWWAPRDETPQRAPDLERALGQ